MTTKEVNIPFVKTIYATKEDFADFQGFVNRAENDPEVKNAGAVKVEILITTRSSLPLIGMPTARTMKS